MIAFHKQHILDVVEIFVHILLQISSFQQWKNFKNRLTFGKVIAKK